MFATTSSLSSAGTRTLLISMIAASILAFILIAVSFAPSVYGQAFPAERARFLGRLLMTTALMIEGGGLGILLAQWKLRWSSTATTLAIILFAVSTLYSLRAVWNIVQDKGPYYQLWSSVWDLRQTQIIANKAEGVSNIIVSVHLYSMDGVEELNSEPKYWINACAANYYGVQSIIAP
jgi:hypothetical protein